MVLPCAGAAPGASGAIAAEMEAVVGEDIGEIMSAKLPVTDAFVREIERMYPSVLFFPRIAMEDIEFNGFTIPKGTPTFYSPYMSHHDPLSFERPDEFDPERWLHEDKAQRPKASLLVGFGTSRGPAWVSPLPWFSFASCCTSCSGVS